MIIESKPVGPFALNVYLVGCPATHQAALIDAGGDLDWVREKLDEHGLEVRYLLQTHGHIDHIAGLAEAKQTFPDAPIGLHRDELPVYRSAAAQGMMFGLRVTTPPDPTLWLEDGARVPLGELTFEVMFTPGHTPGHVVFFEPDEKVLFSGDLLFAGSIGRTDLPGGDYPTIARSLAKVTGLPPETRVYSGHGPPTTMERELRSNPFLS